MKKPAMPADETIRLKSLHDLNILDTGDDERFDRICRLAKQMFATKVAAISLIDTDRQWAKSCIGPLDRTIPRDLSFCAHTILNAEPLVVNHAANDSRFHDNPLVTSEPNIQFYAGYPLKHVNGAIIGTLSIMDDEPRGFDAEDIKCLKDMGELVQSELHAIQLTTQDRLTGLLNANGFRVLSQNSLNMCERLRAPAALAYFDVRDVKQINTKQGNSEGDHALMIFAELLTFGFRDSDVLSRLASDKFSVLLTNTSIANTRDILDRFKERVDRYAVENRLSYTLDYNVGVSWVDVEGDYDFDNLFDEAKNLALKTKA